MSIREPVSGEEQARELSEMDSSARLPRDPLLYPLSFDPTDRIGLTAFQNAVKMLVENIGGIQPEINIVEVQSTWSPDDYFPRIQIKFNIQNLTGEQLEQLFTVSDMIYGPNPGRKPRKRTAFTYPILTARGKDLPVDDHILGYFRGQENLGRLTRRDKGLFIMRELPRNDVAAGFRARQDMHWFTDSRVTDNNSNLYPSPNYLIEMREGGIYVGGRGLVNDGMYQIEIMLAIINIASILAGKGIPADQARLMYEIHHKMNVLGLQDQSTLPSDSDQLQLIRRILLYPLANPSLTSSVSGRPRSVMLAGQMGTGKTRLIMELMKEEHGVIMLPISATDFAADLLKDPSDRTLIRRLMDIAKQVQRPIIVILEDMERPFDKDDGQGSAASNALLNLLAGLFSSGIRLITTTNYPEKLSPQLCQSERLGLMIFCGLPDEDARRSILEKHVPTCTPQLHVELFDPLLSGITAESSEEAREMIINLVTTLTNNFTPRSIREIVDHATALLIERVVRDKGRGYQLEEKDLIGHSYTLQDWQNAIELVLSRYSPDEAKAEDDRLQRLVEISNTTYGFVNSPRGETHGSIVAKAFEALRNNNG